MFKSLNGNKNHFIVIVKISTARTLELAIILLSNSTHNSVIKGCCVY